MTNSLRTLVVDDELYVRQLIPALIAQEGLTCDTAEDGLNALTKCFEYDYQLIITDWHMPEMDGVNFIEHIRNVAGYQDIPIIILTSDTNSERNIHIGGFPEIDWVSKSMSAEKIAKYLNQRVDEIRQNIQRNQ